MEYAIAIIFVLAVVLTIGAWATSSRTIEKLACVCYVLVFACCIFWVYLRVIFA